MTASDGERGFRLERDGALLRLTLARPHVHNAFDEHLIAGLRDLFAELSLDRSVRAMVLAGEGKSFSAGADLNWMRRAADQDDDANFEDALQLEAMLRGLDELPFPVIARIQGAAIGGGLGLVSCSDIAIATTDAVFAASEVRLGIVPAVISPFVIRAIGARQARRYFLTAERMDAGTARALGLIHDIAGADEIDGVIEGLIGHVLKGGREAIAESKVLVREVPTLKGSLRGTFCARSIAMRRASEEGVEGIQAFLDKRKPNWMG